MSVPNKAMDHINSIKSNIDWMNGQLIGMCAYWPDGVDSRAQYVRNLRGFCKEMAEAIENLDTELFKPEAQSD